MAQPLSDPVCVPDTFAEGVGLVEILSDNIIRVTLFANREGERHVVCRIVIPASGAVSGMRAVVGAMIGLPILSDLREKMN